MHLDRKGSRGKWLRFRRVCLRTSSNWRHRAAPAHRLEQEMEQYRNDVEDGLGNKAGVERKASLGRIEGVERSHDGDGTERSDDQAAPSRFWIARDCRSPDIY